MGRIKISVLVPVYNVSEYLYKCLDSLKLQGLKEIEFILINDGSTDGSLEIMEEFKKNDSRFKILDKKNSGYGDSINRGIEIAKGEYIGIVEPDDFCDRKMFETLYDIAKKEKAEIARGNYYYYSNNSKKVHKSIFADLKRAVFNPAIDYEIFCEPPAIWSAIYKTSFLRDNKIRLLSTPGASYQDTGFYLKTLMCAKKIAFVNKPFYYYRLDNPNSSVKDKKKIEVVMKEYEEVERFSKKIENGNLFNKYCQPAKFGSYNWNLLRLSNEDTKQFIKKMKDDFLNEYEEKNIEKKYFSKRYWWSLKILLNGPTWVYFILTIFRKILKRI